MTAQQQKAVAKSTAVPPTQTGILQRQCDCGNHTVAGDECEACASKKQMLQRRTATNRNVAEVPATVHEVLGKSGQPLDSATRAFMEPRLGHDFSQVRIHTDAHAASSARAVNAQAYTVGQNVVFGAGRYAPSNYEGKKLLAHELTHIVQQAGTSGYVAQQSLSIADANDAAEQEADSIANHLGGNIAVATQASAIYRKPDDAPKLGGDYQLKLSSETEAMMLSLCMQGKLDPLQCAKMRLARGEKPSPTADSESRAAELEQACDVRGLCFLQKISPTVVTRERLRAAAQRCDPDPLQYFGVDVCSLAKFDPLKIVQLPVPPAPTGKTPTPAAPTTNTPSFSDLLKFKFKGGAVEFEVELPKSATVKLPVTLSAANTLTFELQAETSKTFSFKIELDSKTHFKVALKSQVSIDDDKGSSGSVGLEIESGRKVCYADNPETLKATLTKSGDDLKKAISDYNNPNISNEDKLKKGKDIASAIGDMYEAVDKSKQACKETPLIKAEFGYKFPIKPSDEALKETDPSKRPAPYIGGTITVFF